jgi:hypothetical protein
VRRLPHLLVAALVAAAVGVAASPGTPAHASGSCAGVWVVVDPTELGGEVAVRCAEGEPASGFDALVRTGFTITQVTSFPGFLCQIDGRPESSCQTVPPATAFWSYWHAEPGGSWTSATEGGGTRRPPVGTVDGWAFGAGDPPSVPPPEPAPAPEQEADTHSDDPQAAPDDVATAEDSGTSDDAGSPPVGGERAALAPDDPRLPRARPVADGWAAGASPDQPPAQEDADDDLVLADEPAAVATERGVAPSTSTAIGILLLAAVAGSALLVGRARRRVAESAGAVTDPGPHPPDGGA